jgi:hypothetical protein
LPSFYRSFYTIIFKKQEAKEEVNKYLEEAKAAVKGSESKKQLFEAVQNLSEALKEVQSLGNLDLPRMKGELSFYRTYCDHAAELMKDTDEKAPYATGVLRRGLPLLDRNLKEILGEVQEKARKACRESKGTDIEEVLCTISKKVQRLEPNNTDEIFQKLEEIACTLKNKVGNLPEKEFVLFKINSMKNEPDLVKKLGILGFIISQISVENNVSVIVEGDASIESTVKCRMK